MIKRAAAVSDKKRLPSDGNSRLLRERSASLRTADSPRTALGLMTAVDRWLRDGKAQGHSAKTEKDRRGFLARFAWWVEHEAQEPATLAALRPDSIRAFLIYLQEPRPGGRWGSTAAPAKRDARPATVNAYFRAIRAFANWCLDEEILTGKPLKNVKQPRVPEDKIEPFSDDQQRLLVSAAHATCNPERDVAIVLLLLDTGMRVSELCGLRLGALNEDGSHMTVTGKGNKRRRVYLEQGARRALWRYVQHVRPPGRAEDALFIAQRGHTPMAGLTANGVLQLLRRLGRMARIEGVRVSPHTCRHSFALGFLRGGGSVLSLKELLGHEDLTVLQRYVNLANVDLEQAHRAASPVERLRLR